MVGLIVGRLYMWGVFWMLVYAILPLPLEDPRSTCEGGALLIPGFGFTDSLLIALRTYFCPFAKSCNAETKLRKSI